MKQKSIRQSLLIPAFLLSSFIAVHTHADNSFYPQSFNLSPADAKYYCETMKRIWKPLVHYYIKTETGIANLVPSCSESEGSCVTISGQVRDIDDITAGQDEPAKRVTIVLSEPLCVGPNREITKSNDPSQTVLEDFVNNPPNSWLGATLSVYYIKKTLPPGLIVGSQVKVTGNLKGYDVAGHVNTIETRVITEPETTEIVP